MNIGIQKKFFNKRFIVTFNAIDPVIQQRNRSFTQGPNFNIESFNTTNTRNFRLTLGYIFRIARSLSYLVKKVKISKVKEYQTKRIFFEF